MLNFYWYLNYYNYEWFSSRFKIDFRFYFTFDSNRFHIYVFRNVRSFVLNHFNDNLITLFGWRPVYCIYDRLLGVL